MGPKTREFKPTKILQDAISSYDRYCDGFGGNTNGNSYLLGLVLGVATTPIKLSHEGSQILDEINAFDRAEVEDTYLGQINMSTISSFCGPQGLIWGYDLVPKNELGIFHPLTATEKIYQGRREIPIYTAKPLLEATKKLFGTREEKRFPLIPGAHVPCAGKNIKMVGPAHLYGALGVGISKDRSCSACLLMEDLGVLSQSQDRTQLDFSRKIVLVNVAKSIIEIAKNQDVEYQEILVGMKDIFVPKGEIGCVLVAAPYFNLARKAIPGGQLKQLIDLNLESWEKLVKKDFLVRNTA